MITLDTELLLKLPNYLLSSKRVNSNAYKGIEEYSEAQSTSNTSKTKFYQTTGYNADTLVEDLKLTNPHNRYKLIKMMKHTDLISLLFLLDKKALLNGLKFFTKEKMLRLLKNLPKSDLICILKQVFTNKEILQMLPMNDVQKFMGSEKIDKTEVFKYLKTLSTSELSQIYEAATGEQISKSSHSDMIKKLEDLRPEQFVEGLRSMPYKQMLELSLHLINKNEELLKEFSTDALMKPMGRMMKSELIEGMSALNEDVLVKLVGELPDAMLAQVATQIDPTQFGDVLLKYFTQLLDKIAA